MKEEKLLNLIHELRNNENCTDKELCDAVKAVNQSLDVKHLAESIDLTKQPAEIGDGSIVKFTKKELNEMPSKIKKIFEYKGLYAHVRQRANGSYDVYMSIAGKRHQGTSMDLNLAKAKFIASLKGNAPKRENKKIINYTLQAIEKIQEQENTEVLLKAKAEAILRTKDEVIMRAIILATTKDEVDQIIGEIIKIETQTSKKEKPPEIINDCTKKIIKQDVSKSDVKNYAYKTTPTSSCSPLTYEASYSTAYPSPYQMSYQASFSAPYQENYPDNRQETTYEETYSKVYPTEYEKAYQEVRSAPRNSAYPNAQQQRYAENYPTNRKIAYQEPYCDDYHSPYDEDYSQPQDEEPYREVRSAPRKKTSLSSYQTPPRPKTKKVGRPRKPGPFDDIGVEKGTLFNEYFLKWLNVVKKPYIKETTYNSYFALYKSGICNYFENVMIEDCDSFFLQGMINSYSEAGHFRSAVKLYNLVNPCFEYAVADGVIDRNPMAKVNVPKYEHETGVPLTREEEKILLESLKKRREPRTQALVFLLYTGMRVGELPTALIRGDFIICNTSKLRKGLSEKKRRIPISPMLQRYMEYIDLQKIKPLSRDSICRRINKLCPGHHTHDLRHTFITRAQEVGIRREIVSMWVGHAADTSMTSRVYTHLDQNEELQLEEMKKFDYEL